MLWRYIAEPKLDGLRAQLHILSGKAVACYSRRGLAYVEWPFSSAIFDGEPCAGDGYEGTQAVFTERNRHGGTLAARERSAGAVARQTQTARRFGGGSPAPSYRCGPRD